MSDVNSRYELSRWTGMSALKFVLLVAVCAVILASIQQVAPSPKQLASGAPGMVNLLDRMIPPNMDAAFLTRMAWRIFETFQIALAGAAIGIAISLPIGWLAAKQVTPIGRFGYLVKVLVSLLRTIPDLIWALLFVATVGLGAVAGTMTIVMDTVGFCGRFFAEAMEDADKQPQEALSAVGASRVSILFAAILPDTAPSLINTSLFALEQAVRSSVVLGLVGAGGIGQELKAAFDLFQYKNAATIILAIFAIVLLMELLTERLRTLVK
ncbi:phosphonate ABC transporter, permease protein PhnE [Phaeobacter sp. C3_T13_0]|uniref:phosphonate ABC transporter, permease protein PhnE n=1 Tax=Phaeobacter cretensis TaxID=3342641 RepID=UPI0039BC5B70